jgi:hypothetical protein
LPVFVRPFEVRERHPLLKHADAALLAPRAAAAGAVLSSAIIAALTV